MPDFKYTPSTPSIKRAPAITEDTPTLVCLSCGDTMKPVRTIPKLGVHPEWLVFVCPSCKGLETKKTRTTASPNRVSSILGPTNASPSHT
jgi:hypothetical protein